MQEKAAEAADATNIHTLQNEKNIHNRICLIGVVPIEGTKRSR